MIKGQGIAFDIWDKNGNIIIFKNGDNFKATAQMYFFIIVGKQNIPQYQ